MARQKAAASGNGAAVPAAVRLGALNEFRPARRNANKHTQRGLGLLDSSLAEDGYVAPMTATADGEIIDGSARLERVEERFRDVAPIVIEHDGTRPIIAKRTDIPNADTPIAKRIAIRANRIAQLDLAWDMDVLDEVKVELPEMVTALWSDEEFEELQDLNGVDPTWQRQTSEVLKLVDVTIAEPKRDVHPHDVWQLGPHRLVCAKVMSEWNEYVPLLTEGAILAPFAGIFAPLSWRAEGRTLVIVQPDRYLAGHTLDRYAEVKGEDKVVLLERRG